MMKPVALVGLAISIAAATTATANPVAPGDVQFDEYGSVAASLTGVAGDPVKGRETFMNRKLGNCLACHENSEMTDQSFHGEVGPSLDGAGDRWTEADLRGIVSNSKMVFEGTIMPAFYVDVGYNRPLDDFAGQPILSAQDVEDVVAYLLTLKEQ